MSKLAFSSYLKLSTKSWPSVRVSSNISIRQFNMCTIICTRLGMAFAISDFEGILAMITTAYMYSK